MPSTRSPSANLLPWLGLLLAPLVLLRLVHGVWLFGSLELGATVSSAEAVARAEQLADELAFDLADTRQVAELRRTDGLVLDGMTDTEARAALESGLLVPAQWCVRFFEEGRSEDLEVCLHPDGDLLSWDLAEEGEPSIELTPDEARATAMSTLARTGLDVSSWTIRSEEREQLPSGGTVHRLTWERPQPVGAARLTAHATVRGEHVVGAGRVVTLPQTVLAERQRLRALHDWVQGGASVLLGLAALLGLALVARDPRRVPWRTAGMVTGVLMAGCAAEYATSLAQLGLTYDPSSSWNDHVSGALADAAVQVVGSGVGWFMVTLGALAVAVRVWPDALGLRVLHPSAWSARWRTETALGLLVAIGAMIWVVTYYRALGPLIGVHAAPELALVSPTVAGLPTAMGEALIAGLWEELALRVLVLGGVVLLTRRWLGERGAWWLAIVTSALLFACLHTNYAQEPWWARVVELTPTWVVVGWLVWRWGPWPGIVAHVTYDYVLMSSDLVNPATPVLAVVTAGMLWLPAVCGGLGLVLGSSRDVRMADLTTGVPGLALDETAPWLPQPIRWLVLAAAVPGGVALWLGMDRSPLPALEGRRHQAVAEARRVAGAPDDAVGRVWIDEHGWSSRHRHVHRADPELLQAMQQEPFGALHPPRWAVLLALHEDPELRRWKVDLVEQDGGWVSRVTVRSADEEPESAPQDPVRLTEAEAEARCQDGWPAGVQVTSRRATERSDRTDWHLEGLRDRGSGVQVRHSCEVRGASAPDVHSEVELPPSKAGGSVASQSIQASVLSLGFGGAMLLAIPVAWRRGQREDAAPPRHAWLGPAAAMMLLAVCWELATVPEILRELDATRSVGAQLLLVVATDLLLAVALAGIGGALLSIAVRALPRDAAGSSPWLLGGLGALALHALAWWRGWPTPDRFAAPHFDGAELMLAELVGLQNTNMAIGLVVGWLLLAHLTRTRWVGVLGPVTVTFALAASGGESVAVLVAAPLLTWLAAQAPRASLVALLGWWWCTTPLRWMVEPPYPGARGGALLTLALFVGILLWVIRTAPSAEAQTSSPSS